MDWKGVGKILLQVADEAWPEGHRMIELGLAGVAAVDSIVTMVQDGRIRPTPAVDGTPRTYVEIRGEAEFAIDLALEPLEKLEARAQEQQRLLALEVGQPLPSGGAGVDPTDD